MNELIIQEFPSKHIALLKLNRVENLNALNSQTLHEMEKRIENLAKQEIRVLIITGTGKAFCAGGDLNELKNFQATQSKEFVLLGHRVFRKIELLPFPVIAALNGFTLGGGCELAAACDLRYAADNTKFGQPESSVGMIAGWGATFRLPRIIGLSKAKELIFTNKLISAQEALQIGLVNGIFPSNQLMDEVLKIAEEIIKGAPIAIRLSKKLIARRTSDFEKLVLEDSEALSECVSSEDQTEAITAFFEKREPVFKNR